MRLWWSLRMGHSVYGLFMDARDNGWYDFRINFHNVMHSFIIKSEVCILYLNKHIVAYNRQSGLEVRGVSCSEGSDLCREEKRREKEINYKTSQSNSFSKTLRVPTGPNNKQAQ